MAKQNKGSTFKAMLWMLFLSVLLCWIPLIGTLFAGLVGGYKSKGLGSAIMAVFLPALIIGGLMFVFASVFTGLPGMGFLAGFGMTALTAINVGPLLVGAVIGALLRD